MVYFIKNDTIYITSEECLQFHRVSTNYEDNHEAMVVLSQEQVDFHLTNPSASANEVFRMSLIPIETHATTTKVQTITKLQGVMQLLVDGIYEQVIAFIDSDETGLRRIMYDAASTWDRDNALIAAIAVVVGYTPEMMDTFFENANAANINATVV